MHRTIKPAMMEINTFRLSFFFWVGLCCCFNAKDSFPR
jgi:hypothetical protein